MCRQKRTQQCRLCASLRGRRCRSAPSGKTRALELRRVRVHAQKSEHGRRVERTRVWTKCCLRSQCCEVSSRRSLVSAEQPPSGDQQRSLGSSSPAHLARYVLLSQSEQALADECDVIQRVRVTEQQQRASSQLRRASHHERADSAAHREHLALPRDAPRVVRAAHARAQAAQDQAALDARHGLACRRCAGDCRP